MSLTVNELYILFRMYSNRMRAAGVQPRKGPTSRLMDLHMDQQHIRWMCDEMEGRLGLAIGSANVDHDLILKANRWLGFIQHGLAIHGFHTIDELKSHNTPTP